jgi:hypothetical protein
MQATKMKAEVMQMNKKIITLLFASLALFVVLSGCTEKKPGAGAADQELLAQDKELGDAIAEAETGIQDIEEPELDTSALDETAFAAEAGSELSGLDASLESELTGLSSLDDLADFSDIDSVNGLNPNNLN